MSGAYILLVVLLLIMVGVYIFQKMHPGDWGTTSDPDADAEIVEIISTFKNRSSLNRYYETEVTEEKDVMVDGIANTVTETKTEFLPLEDGGAGWHAMWGFSGAYEKNLTSSLALIIEGQVMALRDYIDHTALIYLRFFF